MKQFIPNAVIPANMRWIITIFIGIGIVASIAVAILAVSYDPYQAGTWLKLLFFSGLGIVAISLVGILYCSICILINRFRDK